MSNIPPPSVIETALGPMRADAEGRWRSVDPLREILAGAIDSPTVGALADVFGRNAKLSKSYSEQIVDILLPRLRASIDGSAVSPAEHSGEAR